MALGNTQKQKIELFCSYSHKDEELKQELEKHLKVLESLGVIANWHFRKISAGMEWEGEVTSHLNSAHIILLLVSPDFIASNYCTSVEVKNAMKRHKSGRARVIPVILRPVIWSRMPFGKLQSLPQSGKPVTKWNNRDEALSNVASSIIQVVDEIRLQKTKVPKKIRQAHKGGKIIIIEDDIKWLNRIQNVLRAQDQDYKIETYHEYSDKLLVRLERKDYDLLITDISLDEGENWNAGTKLVKHAREFNRNIPIVVITGYRYEDVLTVIDKLIESKMDYFIAKTNWDTSKFLKAVKTALRKEKRKSSK